MIFPRMNARIYTGIFVLIFTLISFIPTAHSDIVAKPDEAAEKSAIDVAAITPGDIPMVPVEATAASVKALRKLMGQALEVAALLPKEDKSAAVRSSEADKADKNSAKKFDAGAMSAVDVAAYAPELKSAPAAQSVAAKLNALEWPTYGYIYSTFGASRGRRAHGAIDIVTKKGTPIRAAADGIVSVVANGGKLFRGYGKIVIVDHGNKLFTVYAHCDSIVVKMGQRVAKGEYIATVGRTGRATTDHCHFEVRLAGKKRDPLKYLPSRPDMVKANNYKSK